MESFKIPWRLKKGIPMMDIFMGEDEFDELLQFEPKPNDMFLITYPKCGTTWTQYIIWGIVHKGAKPPSMNDIMFKDIPFLDVVGSKFLYTKEDPRLFKLHLPPQYITFSSRAKYIFVLRNPWDCCISYYFHCKEMMMEDVSFDAYFKLFLDGNVPYGNYFDYAEEIMKYKDAENVLLLHYEDMKKDHRSHILKIAKFLGDEYLSALDEEAVDKIRKHTDFKYMKDNIETRMPKHSEGKATRAEFLIKMSQLGMSQEAPPKESTRPMNFFRKGQIGDHKNHLSEDQKNQLYEQMKEKIQDPELVEFWSQYMN